MLSRSLGVTLLALGLAATLRPERAEACGGCFHPPEPPMQQMQTLQTVTDHRMVLSVSPTQTTLWDQFSYSGDPSEFSWILPIHGGPEVQVELAQDDFLSMLDSLTAPTFTLPLTPSRNCPTCFFPPSASGPSIGCGAGASLGGTAFNGADASSGRSADGGTGVTVYRQQTVGPYEVVVLSGTDGSALSNWLTTHGFVVPPSMQPTLDYYVSLHTDFVALRLQPGLGETRMSPVRVTSPGAQPFLPLRMVAAGVSDKVGLTLVVVSSSRMEAMNFPNTEVDSANLTYDFSTGNSDSALATSFRNAESAAARPYSGRAWLTESSVSVNSSALQQQASQLDFSRPDGGVRADAGLRPDAAPPRLDASADGSLDAAPSDAASDAEVAEASAPATAVGDLTVALRGLSSSTLVLTRLHASLTPAQLDSDLQLRASTRGDRARAYTFGHLLRVPTPNACAPLNCSSGLVTGGVGEIRGPNNEVLAPDTVFPTDYVPGSVPTFVPPPVSQVRRESDGSVVDASGSCALRTVRPTRRDPAVFASLAVLVGLVRAARRRRR